MASHSFYQPLNPSRREIRLIEIAPFDPYDKSAVISCQLHVVSLIDKPYFVALSYVWGDPDDTTEILVNGTPFQATVNLAGALRQAIIHAPKHIPSDNDTAWTDIESDDGDSAWTDIESDDGDSAWTDIESDDGDSANGDAACTAPTAGDWSALQFWADAICISQEDTDEKNHQIPLMKDIYSGAGLVIGSLGHGENPRLDMALKVLNDICNACVRHIIQLYEHDTLRRRSAFSNPAPGTFSLADVFHFNWFKSLPYLLEPPSSGMHPYWESVLELALTPYFKRVWIIQEMTLAQNLVLMSDNHSFNLDEHAVAIDMLMRFDATRAVQPSFISHDTWAWISFIGVIFRALGTRVETQNLLSEGNVWCDSQKALL